MDTQGRCCQSCGEEETRTAKAVRDRIERMSLKELMSKNKLYGRGSYIASIFRWRLKMHCKECSHELATGEIPQPRHRYRGSGRRVIRKWQMF